MNKEKQFLLKMSEELKRDLKIYAAQHGTTMTAVIEVALTQYLEKECEMK